MHQARPHNLLAIVVVALVSLVLLPGRAPARAAGTNCSTTTSPSAAYTVTLCITAPADGAVLTGDANVTASISVTGTNPGVQQLTHSLDNQYLLREFSSPWTFVLPSNYFVDGTHLLQVQVLFKDGFTTTNAAINLTFANGVTQPPVNTNHFTPASGTTPPAGQPYVLVAVGDGPSDETSVANVSNLIGSLNPNLFLYLGDVYDDGTLVEFYNWYRPANLLGGFRSITNPVVGNHEYTGSSAAGYFDYWDNIPHYYSFNANGWHFIALDSNSQYAQTDPTSAQYQWLAQDLAANRALCTVAYFHHPVYNIGPEGDAPRLSAIWSLLAQYKVTMVLAGHDHDYQHWVTLDGNGNPASAGITQFVAGTGGHGIQQFVRTDSRLAFGFDTNQIAFGALRLKLNSRGAGFDFINTAGTVIDSGVVPCNGAPADIKAPTTPTGLAAVTSTAPRVDLTWHGSLDDTGVSGYTIYRNGAVVGTVNGGTQSFSDTGVAVATSYRYRVDAFDLAGNHSSVTDDVLVTTPNSFTMTSVADSYVDQANPTANFGTGLAMRMDSSPAQTAFLRFTVQGWSAGSQVLLRVFSNSNSSIGYIVNGVNDNTWGERTITYANAPAVTSPSVAASGAITAGTWATVDISSYITGNGAYSLALTTTGTASLSVASRESGNAPQLIVQIPGSTPPPPPPPGPSPTPRPTPQPPQQTSGIQLYLPMLQR